ncbi:MAG: sigma 54-interacting transcriptional regulator [Candidatus Eisenbacteria bacterium]|nr:sigma 54-interacting transcriptional regulator [Candidatus Eisenbacteria bacterium]
MIFQHPDIQRIEKRLETLRNVPADSEYLDRLELLADLYLKQDGYEPALEYLEEILSQVPRTRISREKRLLLEMKVIECLLKRSRCTEALNRCRALDAELSGEADTELSAQLNLLVSHAHWKTGQYSQAIEACEQARRILADRGDERGLAQCQSLFGKSYLRLGEFERAKRHFEDALAAYVRLDDKNGVAVSHNNLGLLHKNHGEWQLACEHLLKALELDKQAGNYGKIAFRRLNLGLVYFRTGQWMKAKEETAEALSIAQRIGDQHTAAAASIALGNCVRALGMKGAADRLYKQSVEIAQRENLMRELALAYEFMGEADAASGEPDRALEKFALALRVAEQIAPEGDIVAEVERRRAEAYLALGDVASARRAARRSLRLCRLVGDRCEEGAALRVIASIRAETGFPRSARVAFSASAGILESVGDRHGLAHVLLLSGRLIQSHFHADEDRLEAKRVLARATGLFAELGAEESLLEAEQDLRLALSDGGGDRESSRERDPLLTRGIARGQSAEDVATAASGRSSPAVPSASSSGVRIDVGENVIEGFVTSDAGLIGVLRSARLLCTADTPVLIQGETGTGKNLLAYMFKSYEEKRVRPFVELNCAAIPGELLESELFGYSRGAFSGAASDKKGILEEAHGGTVFLNEIGEMDGRMQAKLLHVLDDGCYRRVGDTTMRRLSVRIVSATNKDLWKEVQAGTFRRDLYFRLSQATLTISPLRERRQDIGGLCRHFFRVYSSLYSKDVSVGTPGLDLLREYGWPGNVRELKNKIQMLVLNAPDRGVLVPRQIEKSLGNPSVPAEATTLAGKIEELKRYEITRALESCGGNKTNAARALGMSRRGLCKVVERMRRTA